MNGKVQVLFPFKNFIYIPICLSYNIDILLILFIYLFIFLITIYKKRIIPIKKRKYKIHKTKIPLNYGIHNKQEVVEDEEGKEEGNEIKAALITRHNINK